MDETLRQFKAKLSTLPPSEFDVVKALVAPHVSHRRLASCRNAEDLLNLLERQGKTSALIETPNATQTFGRLGLGKQIDEFRRLGRQRRLQMPRNEYQEQRMAHQQVPMVPNNQNPPLPLADPLENFLADLTRELRDDWEDLGRCLGVSEVDLTDIEAEEADKRKRVRRVIQCARQESDVVFFHKLPVALSVLLKNTLKERFFSLFQLS